MNRSYEPIKKIMEYTLPWVVLAILIIYTYARFFQHPYGFRWSSNGIIEDVFVKQGSSSLKVGDQIIKVGQLDWETFHADLKRTFFEGIIPGTSVPVYVNRAGQFTT